MDTNLFRLIIHLSLNQKREPLASSLHQNSSKSGIAKRLVEMNKETILTPY